MKRSIRMTAAIVLSAVLFLTAAFADAYIIDHVSHDCTGEDCPVCAGMHAAEQALLAVSSVVISAAVLFFFAVKAEDELLPVFVHAREMLLNAVHNVSDEGR